MLERDPFTYKQLFDEKGSLSKDYLWSVRLTLGLMMQGRLDRLTVADCLCERRECESSVCAPKRRVRESAAAVAEIPPRTPKAELIHCTFVAV